MDNYLPREVHEEFEKRMEAEHERQNHRITGLEKNVANLVNIATSVQSLAQSVERMTKEQEKQSTRIEALEKKPADNWNVFWRTILTTIASALAGGVIAMFASTI